jgi:hypothetical protein
MRLTNKELRQLIKEELARELKEEFGEAEPAGFGPFGKISGALRRIEQRQNDILAKLKILLNKP